VARGNAGDEFAWTRANVQAARGMMQRLVHA